MRKMTVMLILFVLLISNACSTKTNKNDSNEISAKNFIELRATLPTIAVEDLFSKSSVIVEAIVKEKLASQYTNVRNGVINERPEGVSTDYIIETTNVLKSDVLNSTDIIVRLLKGETDNTVVISDDIPNLETNEKVLLFLIRDDSDFCYENEDYYIVSGWIQGKYTLNEEGNYYNSFNDSTLTKWDVLRLSR